MIDGAGPTNKMGQFVRELALEVGGRTVLGIGLLQLVQSMNQSFGDEGPAILAEMSGVVGQIIGFQGFNPGSATTKCSIACRQDDASKQSILTARAPLECNALLPGSADARDLIKCPQGLPDLLAITHFDRKDHVCQRTTALRIDAHHIQTQASKHF